MNLWNMNNKKKNKCSAKKRVVPVQFALCDMYTIQQNISSYQLGKPQKKFFT